MGGGPVALPFFEALVAQWKAANLTATIVGGFYNGDPPEGPDTVTDGEGTVGPVQKPYLVVSKIGEAPTGFSNTGQYDRIDFEVTLVGTDDLTTMGEAWLPAVEAATKGLAAETDLGNGITLKLIRPGPVRYDKELNYRQVTQEFTARTGKPR